MKTIEKAFQIIDLIEEHDELKFNDIIKLTGFKKSTVHRFLGSLIKHKYVARDKKNLSYKIGVKFLNVSSKILLNLDIRYKAEKYLIELNNTTSETVHLTILIDSDVVYVDKKESNKTIRLISGVGRIAQMYCTAVGKVILAFQTKNFIEKKLDDIEYKKFTKNTITKKEDLILELKKIRKEGFALDLEENEEDVYCIAAPIKNYTGKVIASVSISVLKIKTDLNKLLTYKDLLIEKTQLISESLGYVK